MHLAKVLRVPLTTLLGDAAPSPLTMAPLEAGEAIHRALTWPRQDGNPPDLIELHGQVETAWHVWQNSNGATPASDTSCPPSSRRQSNCVI